jgi:hypothetical protein
MHKCLDRVVSYLTEHKDLAITYDGEAPNANVFSAYSDSDWSVTHSTTGWALMYGNAIIGYGSKRQQSIALSSTEAEITAASRAALEIMFVRGILRDLGVDVSEPTALFVDNRSAIALAQDRRSCHRSRHILRRFLKVREFVAEGHIRVEYVNTQTNAADIFTKSLDKDTHWRHVNFLFGRGCANSETASSELPSVKAMH